MTKSGGAKKRRRRPLIRLPPEAKGPVRLGEDVRPKLTRLVAELAPDEAIAIGSGGTLPTCELAGLADVTARELRDGVRLSANAARPESTDTRAYARACGVAFVLQVGGVDRAVLRRHPAYVPGKVDELVRRHREGRAGAGRSPRGAPADEDTRDAREAVRRLEERVAQLEAERSQSHG
jgi:hypothetical protein